MIVQGKRRWTEHCPYSSVDLAKGKHRHGFREFCEETSHILDDNGWRRHLHIDHIGGLVPELLKIDIVIKEEAYELVEAELR
jgi:hypothetical protein